jgi:hypothetical protein
MSTRRGGSLERGPQVLGRGDVGPVVRRALEQGVGGLVVAVGEVGVELRPRVVPVGVVISFAPVDGEGLEAVGQTAAPGQPHEGRQQQTPGHVTTGTEDDEGLQQIGHVGDVPAPRLGESGEAAWISRRDAARRAAEQPGHRHRARHPDESAQDRPRRGFRLLRTASQHSNRTVRDLALEVVETGTLL